jgi:hypothetical protein
VLALDARAALEIGITQSLGTALLIESERDALVAGLRVRRSCAARRPRTWAATFMPTMRSIASSELAATRACSRSTTRWTCRSSCGACLRWRSIREVFDDHKGLTNAAQRQPGRYGAAITEHANCIRSAPRGVSRRPPSSRTRPNLAERGLEPVLRRTQRCLIRCTCCCLRTQ